MLSERSTTCRQGSRASSRGKAVSLLEESFTSLTKDIGTYNTYILHIITIRTGFCHLKLVSREMVGGRFEMKL